MPTLIAYALHVVGRMDEPQEYEVGCHSVTQVADVNRVMCTCAGQRQSQEEDQEGDAEDEARRVLG